MYVSEANVNYLLNIVNTNLITRTYTMRRVKNAHCLLDNSIQTSKLPLEATLTHALCIRECAS